MATDTPELEKLYHGFLQKICDLQLNGKPAMIDGRGRNIPSGVAYEFGQAIARKLNQYEQPYFLISGDCRTTTPDMIDELTSALTERNVTVLDAGYNNTTPMFEVERDRLKVSGVNITASHQDRSYNGFKVVFDADPDIKETSKFVQNLNPINSHPTQVFDVHEKLKSRYIDRLSRRIGKIDFKGKILFDAMQGSSFSFFQEIARRKGISYDSIRSEPDGRYKLTSRGPDPSNIENFTILKTLVRDLSIYSLIAIVDGDGDRFGAATSQGLIPPPHLAALRAEYAGTDEFVAEYCLASIIKDYLKTKGVTVITTKRGRTNVLPEARHRGVAGAEIGLHNITTSGYDDAIENTFELIQIAQELESNGGLAKKLQEITEQTPHFLPELRISTKTHSKSIARQLYETSYSQDSYASLTDDLVLNAPDFGLFVRGSSNENTLTVNINAQNQTLLTDTFEQVTSQLNQIEPGLKDKLEKRLQTQK